MNSVVYVIGARRGNGAMHDLKAYQLPDGEPQLVARTKIIGPESGGTRVKVTFLVSEEAKAMGTPDQENEFVLGPGEEILQRLMPMDEALELGVRNLTHLVV